MQHLYLVFYVKKESKTQLNETWFKRKRCKLYLQQTDYSVNIYESPPRRDSDIQWSTEVTKIIKKEFLPSRNLKSSAVFFSPPPPPKNTLPCFISGGLFSPSHFLPPQKCWLCSESAHPAGETDVKNYNTIREMLSLMFRDHRSIKMELLTLPGTKGRKGLKACQRTSNLPWVLGLSTHSPGEKGN